MSGEPDDHVVDLTARIADGSHVDWPASSPDQVDAETLGTLKAIAALARLHRASRAEPPDAPGARRWGSLVLIEPIGEGWFGNVYRAWERTLQRQVALKLLRSADGAPMAANVLTEARSLARVRHPNVLVVHGAEIVDGQVGIWTEFIEGCTLEALLRERGPLPAAEVREIGIAICQALGAVHAAGLLHRDVKTQNVMREIGGRIVLMDFGISHERDAVSSNGDLSGTPLYMAPELFTGAPASAATDVYAAGVLVFRLLTDKFPVSGATFDDVRAAHERGDRSSLEELRPDLPADLAGVVNHAIAPNPAARCESAAAFAEALSGCVPKSHGASGSVASAQAGGSVPARIVRFGSTPLGKTLLLSAGGIVLALGLWHYAFDRGSRDAWGISRHPAAPRVVRMPWRHTWGPPSKDGRFVPYLDPNRNVFRWEIATGKETPLTDDASGDSRAENPVLSPDGDRVVYTWTMPDGAYELRWTRADRSWRDTLITREPAYEPVPIEWSVDGKEVLCLLTWKDGHDDLVVVSVDDRQMFLQQRFPGRGPFDAALSPDKRVIAFFASPKPDERYLYFLDVDRSLGTVPLKAPRAVMKAEAGDRAPVWTPDGSGIFFTRVTAPGTDEPQHGWFAPTDGTIVGAPRIAVENIGPVGMPSVDPATRPLVTSDGALVYTLQRTESETYVAPLDLNRGDIGAASRVVDTSIGRHSAPSWSPDGRLLAYYTTRPHPYHYEDLNVLTIKDTITGSERQLQPQMSLVGAYTPRWFPDGRSVIVWGRAAGGDRPWGYFRVEIDTNVTTPVLEVGENTNVAFDVGSDRRFYYVVPGKGLLVRQIDDRFASSDRDQLLIPCDEDDTLLSIAVNRSGAIAFVRIRRSGIGAPALEVRTTDGRIRKLDIPSPSNNLRVEGWTPDGHDVIFSVRARRISGLRRIPATGGLIQDLSFKGSGVIGSQVALFSLKPDGTHIAYAENQGGRDLWFVDGLFRKSR